MCSRDLAAEPELRTACVPAIREAARRQGLGGIRWWPPNEGDFLVEGVPHSLRQLRAELERALGCRVAIYLADRLPDDARERLERETVDLLQRGIA